MRWVGNSDQSSVAKRASYSGDTTAVCSAERKVAKLAESTELKQVAKTVVSWVVSRADYSAAMTAANLAVPRVDSKVACLVKLMGMRRETLLGSQKV